MSNNLSVESTKQPNTLIKVIKIYEARIQNHLDQMVRSTNYKTVLCRFSD